MWTSFFYEAWYLACFIQVYQYSDEEKHNVGNNVGDNTMLSLQRKRDVWSKNKAIIAVPSSSIITTAENKLIIVPCFWLSQWRGLPIMLRSIWNPPPSSWWSVRTVSKFWWFCFPEFLLAFSPTFTFSQYVLSLFSYKSIACSLEK